MVTLLAAFGLMVASTAAPLASTNGYDRTAKLSTGVVAASSVLRSASLGHPKVATASVVQPRSGPSPRFAAEAAGESGAVLKFGSKAAARQDLDGDLGTAANRSFRDATSKSQDFQAQQLSGGGYRLQFFSPANNPGYRKLYVQEIDSAGNVVKEFKNTMGPDGLIETKWVHGGP